MNNAVAQRVWRFFCSVRLALILILVLTVLSVVGALVMQVPAGLRTDPAEYQWWLDNPVQERFGLWAKPLAILRIFDVFHSPWFLGVGLLLVINIIVCTINRWPGIWSSIARFRVPTTDRLYEAGSNRVRLLATGPDLQHAEERVTHTLRRRRYRVLKEHQNGALYLAGDKNRYFRLGTYLVHLSIILFLIAYIIGSYAGFRVDAFTVPEGSVRELGGGTGLSLKVLSFADEYWPEGPPKDYRSDVVLYKDGREVVRGTIRVNHPLKYNGIRFFQSYYGPAVVMKVQDSKGQVIFNDAIALNMVSGKKPYQRPIGTFRFSDSTMEVWVVGRVQDYSDPLLKAGQVRLELYRTGSRTPLVLQTIDQSRPEQLLNYTFTFVREKQFSGFQVSKDPGDFLIWISSGLFVIGMFLVFYFPHRQIWARCRRSDDGTTEVVLRTISSRSYAITSELEALSRDLRKSLGHRTEEQHG